jgi:hypothetical protein
MTAQQMIWEAIRLRAEQKRIDLTGGKVRGPHRSKDIRIDILYRKSTGKCPVCKSRPAKRETCGSDECVSIWTIGHVASYYQKWAWKGAE